MTIYSVAERGLDYLRLCLDLYSENCAFLMLYFVALVFVCVKGSDTEKRIFVPQGLVLLLTVYNPVCPVILMRFFDVNGEYYRFFWIAPVIILVPYAAVKLIMMLDTRSARIALSAVIAAVMVISGNFLYESGYVKAENIYKMPEELIEVSEIIHSDSKVEYPKAFLEYEYNMQMRQYDPKILLTVDREDYLYATSMDYTEEMLADEMHPQYKLLAALIKYQDVGIEDIVSALEATHTEYVVLSKANPTTKLLESAGLNVIGETGNRVVYKYILQEEYEFTLVDYSVVY